jgi:hypothetical protein
MTESTTQGKSFYVNNHITFGIWAGFVGSCITHSLFHNFQEGLCQIQRFYLTNRREETNAKKNTRTYTQRTKRKCPNPVTKPLCAFRDFVWPPHPALIFTTGSPIPKSEENKPSFIYFISPRMTLFTLLKGSCPRPGSCCLCTQRTACCHLLTKPMKHIQDLWLSWYPHCCKIQEQAHPPCISSQDQR